MKAHLGQLAEMPCKVVGRCLGKIIFDGVDMGQHFDRHKDKESELCQQRWGKLTKKKNIYVVAAAVRHSEKLDHKFSLF